jgi:outer membrane receptor for ferric coprogen and ferric-rhodotorulic acid
MGVLGNIGIGEWMATHTTGDWITDVRMGFALTEQVQESFIVNNLSNEVYAIRPMSIEAPRNFQLRLSYTL